LLNKKREVKAKRRKEGKEGRKVYPGPDLVLVLLSERRAGIFLFAGDPAGASHCTVPG
jgi:hypothetical protein